MNSRSPRGEWLLLLSAKLGKVALIILPHEGCGME